LGDRVQVLAVARAVAAGKVFTAADLTQVSATRDPSVPLIAASQVSQVVGRTAVVPLLAGTLLTPAVVGEAAFPPAGQVTASLAVKPGQYPQGLAAGARVAVYVSTGPSNGVGQSAPAGSTGEASTPARLSAVVLGVDLAGDGQGSTVVTLLVDSADAARLAAAPGGGVVLMQTSPEER
jgi:SAF domain